MTKKTHCKKNTLPTLWKSEFMYPFYVNGCEFNLLLQFDRGTAQENRLREKVVAGR